MFTSFDHRVLEFSIKHSDDPLEWCLQVGRGMKELKDVNGNYILFTPRKAVMNPYSYRLFMDRARNPLVYGLTGEVAHKWLWPNFDAHISDYVKDGIVIFMSGDHV